MAGGPGVICWSVLSYDCDVICAQREVQEVEEEEDEGGSSLRIVINASASLADVTVHLSAVGNIISSRSIVG